MEQMPTLGGDGVVVRAWNDGDTAVVKAAGRDPLIPLVSTVPTDGGDESALAFVARQNQRVVDRTGWALAVSAGFDQPATGFVGIRWRDEGRASIGYWTGPGARRRGLASRAVRLTADWALQQSGLHRLEAYIEPWNSGSIRVAEHAGFEREGLMRSYAPVGDRRMDALLYARLP